MAFLKLHLGSFSDVFNNSGSASAALGVNHPTLTIFVILCCGLAFISYLVCFFTLVPITPAFAVVKMKSLLLLSK